VDVQALRDPKAKWILGGAAVVGLVVALRGRGGGGGTGTGTDVAGTPVVSGGGVGAYDSTSADIANQLGQFGVSQQTVLAEYGRSLTEALDALKQVQPKTPAPQPAKTPPATQPAAPKPTAKKPAPRYAVVGSGNLHSTVGKIMAKYGLTLGAFRTLNPGIDKGKAGRNFALKPGTRVRIG